MWQCPQFRSQLWSLAHSSYSHVEVLFFYLSSNHSIHNVCLGFSLLDQLVVSHSDWVHTQICLKNGFLQNGMMANRAYEKVCIKEPSNQKYRKGSLTKTWFSDPLGFHISKDSVPILHPLPLFILAVLFSIWCTLIFQ